MKKNYLGFLGKPLLSLGWLAWAVVERAISAAMMISSWSLLSRSRAAFCSSSKLDLKVTTSQASGRNPPPVLSKLGALKSRDSAVSETPTAAGSFDADWCWCWCWCTVLHSSLLCGTDDVDSRSMSFSLPMSSCCLHIDWNGRSGTKLSSLFASRLNFLPSNFRRFSVMNIGFSFFLRIGIGGGVLCNICWMWFYYY